jgi:hypothetical protein
MQLTEVRDYPVEICISDNHSLDDTAAVVAKYQIHYEVIKYERQDSNLGPGPNQLRALRMARGDYLWLLGDDELTPGSLRHVINALEKLGIGVAAVYVGWESIWDEDYSGLREILDRRIQAQVVGNQLSHSVDEYLDFRLPTVPFMSAHIFNKTFIDWDFAGKHEQSRWLQMYILFQVLSRSHTSLHVARTCVLDDHSKSKSLQLPKDPWPAEIFSTMFYQCMMDLQEHGMLTQDQVKRIASSFYLYVYCDRVSLAAYLSIRVSVSTKVQEFGFGAEIAKALTTSNPHYYRVVYWLISTSGSAALAQRFYQMLHGIRR